MAVDVNVQLREWVGLGQRLLAASPDKVEEVLDMVRRIVEGQELIAEADRLLVLRGKRPAKRYRA
jgi:hypothetical protein